MRDNRPKRKWGKPKLIILTRGRPEESVLTACKEGATAPRGMWKLFDTEAYAQAGGPSSGHLPCVAITSVCPRCSAQTPS